MSTVQQQTNKFQNGTKDMNSCCFIGIDVGTQGTKAVLYHAATQSILQQESVSYSLAENIANVSGRAEQDPSIWENAVEVVLTRIFSSLSSSSLSSLQNDGKGHDCYHVSGIGISGQQHGMVPLNVNYEPIRNAKLWCDVEASVEAAEFSRLATEQMGRTWNIPAGFTAPKVWWLKKNEPQNFDEMKHCLLPHDYITFLLCGGRDQSNRSTSSYGTVTPVTDAGDASGTGVLDPVTRQYIPELTNIIDPNYYNMLPKLITKPNAIAGYLSEEWKKRINIDTESVYYKTKIAISIGSGDNMCSALGVGCVQPRTAVLSLGTSGTIFGVTSNPIIASETNNVVAPFCDATGRHLPLICIMSCTGVLNDVLSLLPDQCTHEEATSMAETVPKGCHGLLFLPFLKGERTPNWPHSKGALLGITSENIQYIHDAGVMYRAAMEGIAYTLRMGLDEIRAVSSGTANNGNEGEETSSFETLLVVGGGSKNALWRQILADILGVTLKFPVQAESAALGAAFQVGAAVTGKSVENYVLEQNVKVEDKVVTPNDDIHESFRLGYERFKTWSKKLYED